MTVTKEVVYLDPETGNVIDDPRGDVVATSTWSATFPTTVNDLVGVVEALQGDWWWCCDEIAHIQFHIDNDGMDLADDLEQATVDRDVAFDLLIEGRRRLIKLLKSEIRKGKSVMSRLHHVRFRYATSPYIRYMEGCLEWAKAI